MIERRLTAVSLAACMSMMVGFCQQPATTPKTPPKPYSERLTERARTGDADAQFELGKNYETGRIGLPKDLAQAQYWYRKAADQGDPYAEASLGILFNFGKGVQRDYPKAYMWYERAVMHAQPGDRDSILELRDGIADNLTPQQLADAKRSAREWKPVAKH